MMQWRRCLLSVGLMALTMSCGSDPAPAPGCVTGQTVACACAGGVSGTQTCGAGNTFGVCACPGVDAGATDVPSIDVPALDGGVGVDVPTVPTDVPTADAPSVDVPTVDTPAVDAGPACPAVLIGATGGTVSCGGATVNIPAGALSTAVPIQIVPTGVDAPSGYTGYSRIFRFEPAGTAFAMPVQVSIPFMGNAARATLFWSRPAGSTGYDRLGGLATGTAVTGSVTHFSSGFIADGVDYTESASRSCTVTRLLEGRTVSPSGVAMFFSAEDCAGNPLTDLTASDFVVNEDGTRLSSESSTTLLTRVGPQVFVSLVLDVSSSTRAFLPQLIAAASQFVTTLQTERGLPVQISLQVFAGESSLTQWQAPTLDTARLLARLDALTSYRPVDPSSTNLYGAVVSALARQATAQEAFTARNAGGAFTSGYVVLFTDGGDTSGLATQAQALAAVRASTNRMLAVGLAGGDAMPAVLEALAPGGVVTAPSTATLTREFNALATRIAGQFRTTYLLGYCSPRRTGMHTVTVGVTGGTTMPIATYEFSATGFGPGCSAATFTAACAAGDQCGGLRCGACDDRTSLCNGTTRQCVNHCVTANQCGGATFTNPLGYSQVCPDQVGAVSCGGTCRDTRTDLANCGACGTACGGGSCVAGACTCPGSMGRACGGVCRDLSNDAANCGACGRVCTSGQECIGGSCVPIRCPPGMVLIPPGSFTMGDADTLSRGAQPPHMVTLSAYCMDLTEVTVAAYRGCTAPGCTTPGTGLFCNQGVTGRDNHPITCVDWNQSRAYCQWRGGDLPTEAQWEYAARGTDERIYPWGNAAPASQLCWSGVMGRSSTCPVQSYASGNSPFGLFDMAGNAWEWTRDFYASYTSAAAIDPTGPTSGGNRVVRGGSWITSSALVVRAAFRDVSTPAYRGDFVGFRCARGAM